MKYLSIFPWVKNLIIIELTKLKWNNKILTSGIYLIKTYFTYASLWLDIMNVFQVYL